jgi:alpha-L-fucosidase
MFIVNLFAQEKKQIETERVKAEGERVKIEHAQIGFVDDDSKGNPHTNHPDAQWFTHAELGMFIHWSIASIKKIYLSWPMMAGTQFVWTDKKPSLELMDKIIASGDFFTGNACRKITIV